MGTIVQEVLRRWLYVIVLRWLRGVLGLRVHYRVRYGEYLYGPRWLVIRTMRLWWDGWSCVDCGQRYDLQVHHTSYDNKGKGLGFAEWWDCVTVCDKCHNRRHGDVRVG